MKKNLIYLVVLLAMTLTMKSTYGTYTKETPTCESVLKNCDEIVQIQADLIEEQNTQLTYHRELVKELNKEIEIVEDQQQVWKSTSVISIITILLML